MPAHSHPTPGARSRSVQAGQAAVDAAPAPDLLTCLAPLLDLAFGTEGEAAFPDEIVALVDRLHAGPLGLRAGREPDTRGIPELLAPA